MDDNLYLDVTFKQNDIKLNYPNHDWLIQRIGIWPNETFKFETGIYAQNLKIIVSNSPFADSFQGKTSQRKVSSFIFRRLGLNK